MRLIDADAIITALIYDEEHEETQEVKMSIADFIDSHTVEGCPQNGGWISVKDRLPEEENACLAVDNERRVVIGRYKSAGNCSVSWYSTMIFFPPITHWMPLPEPPKEDKDDD